jgi:hypothetical protein
MNLCQAFAPLRYLLCFLCLAGRAPARDFFLTIAGGHSRESNQASLENNVLVYQRLLTTERIPAEQQFIYFAAGLPNEKNVQTKDIDSVPRANQLMAEFFGAETDLGLQYRPTELASIRGATTRENIQNWFKGIGPTLKSGDRLILYVTAHGDKSEDRTNPFETSIMLWNDEKLHVAELVRLLDSLPDGVSVVAIMVQCYTGGFAHMIYDKADPKNNLARQSRCGFFATVHDREAAGCTPDVDETTYAEYSTSFWEALAGHARTGKPIALPDYDSDGHVSFAEAHAYTVLNADTIDLPLTTSSEFLRAQSRFRDIEHPDLLPKDSPYDAVHDLATPTERAVLDGLSTQLKLTGADRITAAERESRPLRRGRRNRDPSARRRAAELRETIADDLKDRWPELANVLNPVSIELLTARSKEFIAAIEAHPRYKEYLEQKALAAREPDPQKRRAKFERFVRTAQEVILRENLKRLADEKRLAEYGALTIAESTTLQPAGSPESK